MPARSVCGVKGENDDEKCKICVLRKGMVCARHRDELKRKVDENPANEELQKAWEAQKGFYKLRDERNRAHKWTCIEVDCNKAVLFKKQRCATCRDKQLEAAEAQYTLNGVISPELSESIARQAEMNRIIKQREIVNCSCPIPSCTVYTSKKGLLCSQHRKNLKAKIKQYRAQEQGVPPEMLAAWKSQKKLTKAWLKRARKSQNVCDDADCPKKVYFNGQLCAEHFAQLRKSYKKANGKEARQTLESRYLEQRTLNKHYRKWASDYRRRRARHDATSPGEQFQRKQRAKNPLSKAKPQ